MKIIMVNGVARSGKDTLIQELSRALSFNNEYICLTYSTIDEVKRLAKTLGWNGEKTEKSRKFLCDLKKLWTDFNNGPNNDVLKKVVSKNTYEDILGKEYIIFIQCREPAGIDFFKESFKKRNIDCRTILVLRENVEIPDNPADNNVFDYSYDYYINNNEDIYSYYEKIEELKDKLKEDLII